MQRRLSRVTGFSISELAGVLATLTLVAALVAILFPLFAQSRAHHPNNCHSNLRQISLGMLMYAQDYDEQLPPARSFQKTANGRVMRTNWGISYHLEKDGQKVEVEGLTASYIRNNAVFRCPDIFEKKSWFPFQPAAPTPERETYMYNDLAATEKMETFTAPAHTILVAEGEDIERNVGHSWESDLPPQQAIFDSWGKCRPERAATVQNAPTRHHGGANYAYADGHCKWHQPEDIFFPPRTSADIAHNGSAPGPNPVGNMLHQGHTYLATFHLK